MSVKTVNFSIRTKKLTCAALFIATGILLPQIFHLVGGSAAGKVGLPMHIPVLLAGLLLGWEYGAVVGAVTPLISFLLTGMPAAAILPIMLLELMSYGILTGILYRKFHLNLYISLIGGMLGGRVVNALILLICGGLLHLTVPPAVSVAAALVTGLPGIIIQLVFVPILVTALRKAGLFRD